MKVSIQLKASSQPIHHDNATNTYQKGDMYCVYVMGEDVTYKYPISTIWRIKETYGEHQTKEGE